MATDSKTESIIRKLNQLKKSKKTKALELVHHNNRELHKLRPNLNLNTIAKYMIIDRYIHQCITDGNKSHKDVNNSVIVDSNNYKILLQLQRLGLVKFINTGKESIEYQQVLVVYYKLTKLGLNYINQVSSYRHINLLKAWKGLRLSVLIFALGLVPLTVAVIATVSLCWPLGLLVSLLSLGVMGMAIYNNVQFDNEKTNFKLDLNNYMKVLSKTHSKKTCAIRSRIFSKICG